MPRLLSKKLWHVKRSENRKRVREDKMEQDITKEVAKSKEQRYQEDEILARLREEKQRGVDLFHPKYLSESLTKTQLEKKESKNLEKCLDVEFGSLVKKEPWYAVKKNSTISHVSKQKSYLKDDPANAFMKKSK